MTWQQPDDYERWLLEDAAAQQEDLLPLARVLAQASRIEPRLLRNARLRFCGDAGTQLEARLWFSPLVAARNSREIVFHPGVARLLAEQLKQQEPQTHQAAWDFIRDHTRHWSPEDRLEQDLRHLAAEGGGPAFKAGLRDMLRRIHQEQDPTRRTEYARWTRHALPQITDTEHVEDEARLLAHYAAQVLGATAPWSDFAGTPRLLPAWLAAKLPQQPGQARLALDVAHDPTRHTLVLQCRTPAVNEAAIEFSTPLPAKLFIGSGIDGAWHVVNTGSRIELPATGQPLRLVTLAGRQYDLAVAIPEVLSTPEQQAIKLYLSHQPEDADLAALVATMLLGLGLKVELLDEERLASLEGQASAASGVRLLRLWTSAAHKRDAAEHRPAPPLPTLLLRMGGAEQPPSGTGQALTLDISDLLSADKPETLNRFMQSLQSWLTKPDEPGVSSSETSPDEIASLLAELDDPETIPPRRLAIGDRLAELGDPRPGVGVVEIEVAEESADIPADVPPSRYSPEITRLLAEIAEPATIPPRRLEIGDRLAELGDPRPGVGLDAHGLPDIDWVEIPGGPFIYQQGETRELPTFWIARYPVTNAQFQAFIDDGGYRQNRWWQGLRKPKQAKSSWPQANRPRTDVDWFEAVAFSRWLCARLGLEAGSVRLPTEEEWERAARGTVGWTYPWGDNYHSGYANIDETWEYANVGEWNLQQTTAVGAYTQGFSPEGAADLAGNVWEWCLTKYEQPNQTKVDESWDRRVFRGGSWQDDRDLAGASLRDSDYPDHRLNDVGFRLLSSVPISTADRTPRAHAPVWQHGLGRSSVLNGEPPSKEKPNATKKVQGKRGKKAAIPTPKQIPPEEPTMFEDDPPANDTHTFGGPWTMMKLEALEKYLRAFNIALSKQNFARVYFDAFSGTGRVTLKKTEGSTVVDGSPRRALKIEPGFHHHCFIELQARKIAALNTLADEFPAKSIEVIEEDANFALRELCQRYNWRDTRAVLFLDPYGLHVDWATLEAVAATQAIDVWYLFPYSGLYRQAAKNSGSLDKGKEEAITRILGTDEWRSRFYAPPRQVDMFGHQAGDEREDGHEALLEFVSERLRSLFPAVTKPKVLYQGGDVKKPKGAPLFALYFAAANPDPKAFGLATRIAQDVLNAL